MNKPIDEKLRILSDAAKYDASCSSSGSSRKNTSNGLGNAAYSGICHSWSADGRCVSLLKILMTNLAYTTVNTVLTVKAMISKGQYLLLMKL